MSLGDKENTSIMSDDIWRDTNEEIRRLEWKSTAKLRRSVREEMDRWKPRSRESAKRMKQSISQIRLDVIRTWGTHSAYSTVSSKMPFSFRYNIFAQNTVFGLTFQLVSIPKGCWKKGVGTCTRILGCP
jgi:hypothetical protein